MMHMHLLKWVGIGLIGYVPNTLYHLSLVKFSIIMHYIVMRFAFAKVVLHILLSRRANDCPKRKWLRMYVIVYVRGICFN
jgi:hypothetical protein